MAGAASALFLLDIKGLVLVWRDYRGDVSALQAERFFTKLIEKEHVTENEKMRSQLESAQALVQKLLSENENLVDKRWRLSRSCIIPDEISLRFSLSKDKSGRH